MHVTLMCSGLLKAQSQGNHFVEYREEGGRGGIIFLFKVNSALSFFPSIICMSYNEKYFVTLIGKHVNKTKYLTSYTMSSAVCILTSNLNGLKHDSELPMNHTSHCGTLKVWSQNFVVTITRSLQCCRCVGTCS